MYWFAVYEEDIKVDTIEVGRMSDLVNSGGEIEF